LNGIYGWLAEASRDQKRALLAASLGWMLDSMDVMLYALVLGQVQGEMHLSAAMSGAMMSVTLIAAAVGGIGFGWFADRCGRVRALTLSVLVYSVATALCGFSHTAAEFMICRVVLGLGMGGEWASGAALVAETWPARHRGTMSAALPAAVAWSQPRVRRLPLLRMDPSAETGARSESPAPRPPPRRGSRYVRSMPCLSLPTRHKNRFDRAAKQPRDLECQWQAGIVLAGFDRVDRLS
jgi:hypothetical protein